MFQELNELFNEVKSQKQNEHDQVHGHLDKCLNELKPFTSFDSAFHVADSVCELPLRSF